MSRLFTLTILIAIATVTSTASAQGLPMTDQLGSGVYGMGGGGGHYTPSRTVAPTRARPMTRTPNRGGFNSVPQGLSPQQIQNISAAAAALGPAIQQARQNLQAIRARNGGTLIPRNNQAGFGNQGGFGSRIGGGRLMNRLMNGQQQQQPQWQGMQRYTDTFGSADANRVRQDLVRDGFRNVRVFQNPNNGWRRQQGLTPTYGVYYDR